MSNYLYPVSRWTSAAAAISLLAACADQPTTPSPLDRGTNPLFSTASTDHLPALHSNSVKYRDQGLKPATGRSGSAQLTVRALLGKDNVTDLEITTGELDVSTAAPGNISKLQVKGFDPAEELQFTQNYNGLEQGGYVAQRHEGRARHSKIQVQGNVDGIDPQRTGVVTVTETVKLRPDLKAADLAAPQKAKVNTPVNISATISELNADVGAHADCVLYVDGAEADRAGGIWVDAAGTVSCAFTQTFTTTGTKGLEVRAEGVVPGDYDLANNAVSGTVEITRDNDFYYWAYASDHSFDHNWHHNGSWESYEYDRKAQWEYQGSYVGRAQYAYNWGYMPKRVSFPLTSMAATHSTGGATILDKQFNDVPADWTGSWGDENQGHEYGCATRAEFDNYYWMNWVHVCSGESRYSDQKHPWTYVSSGRYAGDVTYLSTGYHMVWYRSTGELAEYWTWNYSGSYKVGTFVEYGDEYAITMDVESDGQTYSTSPVVTLQSFNYEWDNRANPWRYIGSDSWGSWDHTWRHWGFSRGKHGSAYGQPD